MIRALIVAFAVALGSCAVFTPPGTIPVSQALSPAAQAVQASVNEMNVLLTAAANVVAQNVGDGIVSKEEARQQITKIKSYAQTVDQAQALLRSGDAIAAKNKVDLVRGLVVSIHREVAARARR